MEASSKPNQNQQQKPPLRCWGCGEPHYYKNCPHYNREDPTTNIQEAFTFKKVARNINAAFEYHQNEYQSKMVEVEVKLDNHHVYILIGPNARLSYVNLKVFEISYLQSVKFRNLWLV